MIHTTLYPSPLGEIRLVSEGGKLSGLWFVGEKADREFEKEARGKGVEEGGDELILQRAKEWLERYFKGENPRIDEIPLSPSGSAFAKQVWELLVRIPYGEVCTYGELAKEMARITHKHNMAAQAIGGAVGRNPISIIIPCHRVIGANGNLTGYAGGLEKKVALLELERADLKRLYRF